VNDRERSVGRQGLRLAQDTLRESPAVNWMVFTDYLRSIVPYLKTLPAMVNHKLEEALPLVTCPVVLMRGERDPIVPSDWLERLAAANPNSTIVEVPGVPHVLMYSRPAETARGLLTGDPRAAA
jgi:pimeloyl-ACP methyl ester carboxylesterase